LPKNVELSKKYYKIIFIPKVIEEEEEEILLSTI
jgi:hypothetical protein